MADSNVAVLDSGPSLIDAEQETINAQTVQRQRVILVPGQDPRGCSEFHLVSGAGTNANNVKASPGQLYGYRVYNNAGYPIYVKLHNTAGTPTAGSGVVATIAVQAGQAEKGFIPPGRAFSTGIAMTIVKGIADADTSSVAANDCVVDLLYA